MNRSEAEEFLRIQSVIGADEHQQILGLNETENLPDLVPLLENLSRLSEKARNKVKVRLPPYEGQTPGLASVFMDALPIIPLFDKEAFDKWKAADDAYKAKVAQRAKERYGVQE
jgi:hypothetical protein